MKKGRIVRVAGSTISIEGIEQGIKHRIPDSIYYSMKVSQVYTT